MLSPLNVPPNHLTGLDYTQPLIRFPAAGLYQASMDVLSRQAYQESWQALDIYLQLIEERAGLGAALLALHEHQVQSGFVRDELKELRRFHLPHPETPEHFFSVQYNPARGRRFEGAGRFLPDMSDSTINGGCFLCADNIWWQQRGAESGYHLRGLNGRYTAWMNPFPLVAGHAVIASREHLPQHWQASGGLELEALVTDLIDMATSLPDWLLFYNGVGAGASIPYHLHLHAIPRAGLYGKMPLEIAAQNALSTQHKACDYPLSFVHWRSDADTVRQHALTWAGEWLVGAGAEDDATANIIASRTGADLDLYFVPRHQRRSRAEGLAGVVGGFEALGEIVCSSDEELANLESGRVDYFTIERMLSQVSVAF